MAHDDPGELGDAESLAEGLSEYRAPNGAGYNAGYSEGHEGGTDYEDDGDADAAEEDGEEEEEELDVGGASLQDNQQAVGWGRGLRGEQGAGEEGAGDAGLSITEGSVASPLNTVAEPAQSQAQAQATKPKPKPTPEAKPNSGNSASKRMTRSSVKAKPSEVEKGVAAAAAADREEGGASAVTVVTAGASVRRRPKRATAAAAEAAGWEIRAESSEEEDGVEEEPPPQKQVAVEVQRRSRSSRRASSRGKGGVAAELAANAAAEAEAEEDAAEAAAEPEPWESDDDEMENVADCAKPGCESDGVLVLCDNCAGATHLECADPPMVEVPAEFYLCAKCRGMCSICLDASKRDTDIRCHQCYRLFHSSCLDSVPDPEYFHWICSSCCESDDLKVETILHCRTYKPMDADVRLSRINAFRAKKGFEPLKSEQLKKVESPYQGREYLVRWEGKAFWHCTWLVPYLLQRKSPTKLNNFIKKTRGALTAFPQSIDQVLLAEYKPKCTVPHRVIARQTKCMDGVTQQNVYLVKWRGLEYEECTWEMENDLEEHMDLVEAFINREKHGPTKEMLGNLHPPDDWDGTTPLPKPTRFELLTEQPWGLRQGPMYPYQLEGLNFLRQSWWSNTNVILADEMGLGKTIQTIAFIRSTLLEKSPKDHRPCIVICPLSTTDNWERELELWCPELNCVRFVGNLKSRTVLLEHELFQEAGNEKAGVQWEDTATSPGGRTSRKGKGKQRAGAASKGGIVKAGVPKFHVIITHYEMLFQCSHILKAIKWELLIVDEAHRLKAGATSKVCQLTASLDTRHRLLLTGTPLQNTVDELFNLLQFIEPHKFYDKTFFLSQFANLEREGQVAQLQKLLKPHMLRRMKKDVPDLDIPDKRELVVPVELSSEQKEIYRAILTKNMDVLRKGDKNRGTSKGLQNIVMQLKKTCNHPYLCRPRDAASVEDLVKASGKLQLLDSMLKKLHASGNRVLVFSQMTALLDILQDYASFRRWSNRRIDGNTPATDRQRYIDDFNQSARGKEDSKPKDEGDQDKDAAHKGSEGGDDVEMEKSEKKQDMIFLFFLSTKAGGQGINLATADTVIIYDSDWNPHNDLQALARAHRIGQANKVMIYRFVSRATVEERILEVAKKKLLLEHVVVQDGNKSMTQEQLNLVIKYGAEDLFREESDDEKGHAAAPAAAASLGGGESEKQTQAEKWGDGSHRGRKVLQWTDEAVDQLLDRSAVSEEGNPTGGGDGVEGGAAASAAGENALGSLLQTFKVASFAQVQAPAEEGEREVGAEEDDDGESNKGGNVGSEGGEGDDAGDNAELPSGDALFGERPADTGADWEEILAKSYRKHQMNEMKQAAALGRGKREKTQVRLYAADETSTPTASEDSQQQPGEGGKYYDGEGAEDDDADLLEEQQEQPDEEFAMPPTKSSKAAAGASEQGTEGGGEAGGGAPAGKKRHRLRDASIDVLESTEGVKTVIRCVVRYGVPGGDWRPVMQAVVTNSKLHLDPALADDIVPATPFLQNALKKALEPDYPHAAGKRRELLSRIAAMELIYRKLEECRSKPFDIQDKLCGVYMRQVRGQAMHQTPEQRWTRENDRSLLIGCLKHGSGRFQNMIQDDTLGLRPALELALENAGKASWQLVWDDKGPTGQPGFKGSPEWKFVKERLAMLEKALVDEHQYKTGKGALESELKTMLAKQQEALEPNDKRIEMLIAKVKATQEREVPELMRRLAAVEAFQAVGEEVTAMRGRQENARRRLADAFSAMSAYIQRYRCQESEFDLGSALMNPMADCIAEVQEKHSAVRRLHQENKDLDMEFDATLRRYVLSVNDYVHSRDHVSRGSNLIGTTGIGGINIGAAKRQGNHSSEVVDLAGGSESPRSQTYSPSFTGGGSGSGGGISSAMGTMIGRTLQPARAAPNGQRWSDQRHQQQQQLAGVGVVIQAAPLSSTLQQTLSRRRDADGTGGGGGGGGSGQTMASSVMMRMSSSSAEAPSLPANEGSGGAAGARQGDGGQSASLSPRGMMFLPTSSAGAAGEASVASEQERRQQEQEVGRAEESEGVQQVRHLVRVRQAMLGGGDAGIAVDGGKNFTPAPATWGIAAGSSGGGRSGGGSSSGVSETPGSAGGGSDFEAKDPQDDLVRAPGTVADANDTLSASLADFDDHKSAAMSQGVPVSASAEAPADTASVSDGIVWELAGADGTAASDAALDEEFWAADADAGGDGDDDGGGGGGGGVDGGEHSTPANDMGRIDADGVVNGPANTLTADDGLWGFDDGDGGLTEHLQKKPRVE